MSSSSALLLVTAVVTAALAVCYVRGLRVVRNHPQGRRVQRWWRPCAAAAALVVVVGVAGSPLGELLEERLSTHMVQHLVLMLVAAPLLAFAAPGQPLLAGLPRAVRRPLVRLGHRLHLDGLLGPHLAWVAYVLALWGWHLPAAYDAALRSETTHELEHATFLLTAWLFWWHLATVGRRRLRGIPATLYLVASIPPGAALGAVLTFPNHPLYPTQAALAAASGVNPLHDQRLAGLVMWVPLDFAFVLVAVLILARWMRGLESRWPEPQLDVPADALAGTTHRIPGEVAR
jgi:cytochrome c oxidase assembly factor CtaG